MVFNSFAPFALTGSNQPTTTSLRWPAHEDQPYDQPWAHEPSQTRVKTDAPLMWPLKTLWFSMVCITFLNSAAEWQHPLSRSISFYKDIVDFITHEFKTISFYNELCVSKHTSFYGVCDTCKNISFYNGFLRNMSWRTPFLYKASVFTMNFTPLEVIEKMHRKNIPI